MTLMVTSANVHIWLCHLFGDANLITVFFLANIILAAILKSIRLRIEKAYILLLLLW